VDEIVSKACREAEIYKGCGVHGVMVENMHDVPYLQNRAGSEVTACMTRVAGEVRKVAKNMILGVQILSCELRLYGKGSVH
jgi:predicted TIM-barrel enzyme